MNAQSEKSYVLFPLGRERFAVPAEVVKELARPDNLQTFPHRTPLLSGVLLRRGRVVPVCDVAQLLVGPEAPARKFYLIANCGSRAGQEWTAIPVTGECELSAGSAVPINANGRQAEYVTGFLATGGETVKIVDLEKLMAMEARQ